MSWVFVIVAVIAGGFVTDLVAESRKRSGREPMDLPPLLAGSGKFTAPVRAVTRGGITVRQPKCCLAGHRTPGLAVSHAREIAGTLRSR